MDGPDTTIALARVVRRGPCQSRCQRQPGGRAGGCRNRGRCSRRRPALPGRVRSCRECYSFYVRLLLQLKNTKADRGEAQVTYDNNPQNNWHICRGRRRADRPLFRNRRRQAHRLAREVAQRLRGKNGANKLEKQAQRLYRQLVRVTETTVAQVEVILVRLQSRQSPPAQRLAASLQHDLPLVRRVIAQTRRCVFDRQSVPATQKVVTRSGLSRTRP